MAEQYDTERFGELYYASKSPSTDNLALAARYICQRLEYYQIPHAIMGGWAMFLRGGQRQTHDVDLTVETTMDYLKSILLQDQRICFPRIHGQATVTIFIWTGESYDQDFISTINVAVYMDIVISGNLGIPRDLRSATELIQPSVSTPQGSPATVLGLVTQVSAKLTAFFERGRTSNNDFQDLVYLLFTYYVEVGAYRDHLDFDHRKAFVQQYAEVYIGQDDVISYVKQLLGVP